MHEMFAVVAPGLEEVCADEMTHLGLASIHTMKGGVAFAGERADMQRANLMLRSASRILVRLGSFRARDFPQLYRRCRDLPWGSFVKPSATVRVSASSRVSRLGHTGRIAETVADAVDNALGAPTAREDFEQRVFVRIEDDVCTVSVDSSGELLHRRGYRTEAGAAPLRETLAAGILLKLGWTADEALVDPMCGSGSFMIEAAMIAAGLPPGLQRDFAFKHWPKFRPGAWQVLLSRAQGERAAATLVGADIDPAVLEIAARNERRAGVGGMVRWQSGGFGLLEPPAPTGLVICNPPYGARLGEGEALRRLYRDFGVFLRASFRGWRFAFLCPDPELARLTCLPSEAGAIFSNGGIRVILQTGRVA